MAKRGRNKERGPLAKKSSKSIKDELLALTPLSDAIDFYKAAKSGNVMEAAMAAGMMGLAATPAGPLAKGAKAVKKYADAEQKKLDYLRKIRKQLAEESRYEGYEPDIYFRHSMTPSSDFPRTRPVAATNKPAYGKGPGAFFHGLDDAIKFQEFGPNVYAAVVNRKAKVYPGKMDDVSDKYETFIPESAIDDYVRVYPPLDYKLNE